MTDRSLRRQADIMKKLARAVVALEDVARDGSWLDLTEDEMIKTKRAYRELNNILYRLEQSGIEKKFIDAGLLKD